MTQKKYTLNDKFEFYVEDGYIRAVGLVDVTEQNARDMQKLLDKIYKDAGFNRRLLLVDLSNIKKVIMSSRNILRETSVDRLALVTRNIFSTTLARLFVTINRETRIFKTIEEGRKWILRDSTVNSEHEIYLESMRAWKFHDVIEVEPKLEKIDEQTARYLTGEIDKLIKKSNLKRKLVLVHVFSIKRMSPGARNVFHLHHKTLDKVALLADNPLYAFIGSAFAKLSKSKNIASFLSRDKAMKWLHEL